MSATSVPPTLHHQLRAPFAIIGLYSNVNEGGAIQQDQVDWLTSELATEP